MNKSELRARIAELERDLAAARRLVADQATATGPRTQGPPGMAWVGCIPGSGDSPASDVYAGVGPGLDRADTGGEIVNAVIHEADCSGKPCSCEIDYLAQALNAASWEEPRSDCWQRVARLAVELIRDLEIGLPSKTSPGGGEGVDGASVPPETGAPTPGGPIQQIRISGFGVYPAAVNDPVMRIQFPTEPPAGSVVLDNDLIAWQHDAISGWWLPSGLTKSSTRWARLIVDHGPLRLLRLGGVL